MYRGDVTLPQVVFLVPIPKKNRKELKRIEKNRKNRKEPDGTEKNHKELKQHLRNQKYPN